MEVNKYTFFLDSKYRNSGSNAAPKFFLDDPVLISNPNNYFKCKVKSVEIPYSFKNVQIPNNSIPIQLISVNDSINISGTITIAPGNYTILSLLDELKQLLLNYITPLMGSHSPDFYFTYDKDTGKSTLNIVPGSGNHTVTLTLKWSQADIVAELFGFTYENNTVLSYISNSVNSSNYISPNNVNVSPISSLKLRSSSLHQVASNQERLVENFFSISDILLSIPISSYFNTWILYDNDTYEVKLNNKEISELSFYVTAQTYDSILFNGVHWKIALEIIEYEPEWMQYVRAQQLQLSQESDKQLKDLNTQRDDLMGELAKIRDEMAQTIAK